MTHATYVFGYASLVASGGSRPSRDPHRPDPDRYVTDVLGMRRAWGVAMDNARTIPGYKYYVEAETRCRPEVFVSFLDLKDDATTIVNGLCLRVEPDELAALDQRERNYTRVEITDRVALPLGRVWTFVGSEAGRERLATAQRGGHAVIDRRYLDAVEAGFRWLGEEEYQQYMASTDPVDLPVRDLERVDLSAP